MLYEALLRPLLFSVDPELAHRSTIRICHWLSRLGLARWCVGQVYDRQFPELAVTTLGLRFRNPVGLAAGYDKHAEMYSIVPDLGFGHMEVGSVSLRPWRGNPSPTLLRLQRDLGLINRLGLNSVGSQIVLARLRNAQFRIPTGLNLVKTANPEISGETAMEDYVQNFAVFYHIADFITLNVSCPNTADGQTFEDVEILVPFLERLRKKEVELLTGGQPKPVLIKLSPDLDDATLDRVLAATEAQSISGYVIANTTARREGLRTPAATLQKFGQGGLSGLPLTKYNQAMVRKVWERTGGRQPIIASGGIGCDPDKHPAEVVWEYFELGATLVQLHTGLIYRGPSIVKIINSGLVEIIRRKKLSSLSEFFARRAERITARR